MFIHRSMLHGKRVTRKRILSESLNYLLIALVSLLLFMGCSGEGGGTNGPDNNDSSPLIASFICNPSSGVAPLTVNFENTSTGDISSYLWDFGDGSGSTQKNPSHTYNSAGNYTISLKVLGESESDEATKYITVSGQTRCTANFSATPTFGKGPLEVIFSNLSEGPYTSCTWDFGDGDTSNLKNPVHTYQTEGTYTVILEISSSSNQDVEIKRDYIVVSKEHQVDPFETQKLFPTRVSGDCNLDNGNPHIEVSAILFRNSNNTEVRARLTMTAKETEDDWTEANGSWDMLLFKADPGWKIVAIPADSIATVNYNDSDYSLNTFESPFCTFEIDGSTMFNDVCNTLDVDRTHMRVKFKSITIELSRE